jgi:regulator of sigma E protease
METFLIKALQLILSLSILVLLHEMGHFLFARLFKVRVEKFYMFFNPTVSLVRAKKINGKWDVKFFAKNIPANERPKLDAEGDQVLDAKGRQVMEPIPLDKLEDDDWRKYPDSTEWGIGWLPLGGYCKISGMIDESMDSTQMAMAPQPWEYRSRPVWQRLPIITGGVLVNFILAMIIYAGVLFTWGQEYIPVENAKFGYQFAEVMQNEGFRNGDVFVKVDDENIENQGKALNRMLFSNAKTVTVLRDGQTVTITLSKNLTDTILKHNPKELVSLRFPYVIDGVQGGSPASAAKLEKGDSIISVNGKKLYIYQDILAELNASKNSIAEIEYVRNGKVYQTHTQINDDGKLGVKILTPVHFFKTKKITYGFFEAIPAGISLGWETLSDYVSQLKYVFTKSGIQQVGGFGAIGGLFPPVWDWQIFWEMTALLSVILAFMNFLPIPALDGGHVMFLLYEMITRRKPSDKFLEYAQTAGMLLLFALLIYANGNDIFRAIFK